MWTDELFLTETSELYNPEHDHLRDANIGWLWTNVENVRQGKRLAGRAELGKPVSQQGKWTRERQLFQLRQWFDHDRAEGEEFNLDFLITLNAAVCVELNPMEFCALVEHEMYHCGQKVDEFLQPMFSKTTGKPLYAMRGHDVEEFTGIVRRYGIDAAAPGTIDIVAAAAYKPELTMRAVSAMCGNCILRLV